MVVRRIIKSQTGFRCSHAHFGGMSPPMLLWICWFRIIGIGHKYQTRHCDGRGIAIGNIRGIVEQCHRAGK